MVSAFQSREFGWGMDIAEEQMVGINEMRMGKEHFDMVANDVNGSAQKPPLTASPIVCLFDFGGRNKYSTGNHMNLQMKDCIGCLKAIMSKHYDFVFLFDYSSGHTKKRAGGLDVKSMNKGVGGELSRNSKNEEQEDLPWPISKPLKPASEPNRPGAAICIFQPQQYHMWPILHDR